MGRVTLRFLVAPLLLLIAVPAWAQSPPAAAYPADDDPALVQKKQQAKDHFIKGVELVQNGDWDAALAEFLASREVYPTRVALENAAISLRQLKRHVEALEMYRELLAKFGSSLPPDKAELVNKAIAQLEQRVGQLSIEIAPAGSVVVVDGRQRGTVPLQRPLDVDAGSHTVRAYKPGYETFETQVQVAGRQLKTVSARLVSLRATGTLTVAEASGGRLKVVVDGAVVGTTPWSGPLAVGAHSVLLRGEGEVGTPPSETVVRLDTTTSLSLRAVVLDAPIRVVPTPSSAQVNIDGVNVGNGVWEGRLASGSHSLEVAQKGFNPYRKSLHLSAGKLRVVGVELERDLSDPIWQAGFVPHVYLEAVAGPAWAPSLGGGADASCSSGCDRARPLGFLAGARGGYQLTPGLGLELLLGALDLKETTARPIVGSSETGDWTSTDYEDSTQILGPLAAASVSYRFFETTPLTFRVWAGATRVTANFTNGGRFSGNAVYQPAPPASPEATPSTQYASIPEEKQRLWIPFVGPEARLGYRFSKHVSVDLGVALLIMFAPDAPRTGSNAQSHDDGDRRVALDDVRRPDGNLARSGILALPKEDGFGTFFLLSPSMAGRFDF